MAYRASGGLQLRVGTLRSAKIITAAGPTGGPHVKVFTLGGTTLTAFYAHDIGFTGGVFVASGNVNTSGYDELITGADAGGGPHVKIFTCCVTLSLVEDFYAWIPPGANLQPP